MSENFVFSLPADLDAVIVSGHNPFRVQRQLPEWIVQGNVGVGADWAATRTDIAISVPAMEVDSLQGVLKRPNIVIRQKGLEPLSLWLVKVLENNAKIGICDTSWSAGQAGKIAQYIEQEGFPCPSVVRLPDVQDGAGLRLADNTTHSLPHALHVRLQENDLSAEVFTRGAFVGQITGLRSVLGGAPDAWLITRQNDLPPIILCKGKITSLDVDRLTSAGYIIIRMQDLDCALDICGPRIGGDNLVINTALTASIGARMIPTKEPTPFPFFQVPRSRDVDVNKSFDRAMIESIAQTYYGVLKSEAAVACDLQKRLQRIPEYRGLAFPISVASGERSAHPHAMPAVTNRTFLASDVIMIDAGMHTDAITTDATRMVIKSSSESIRSAYTLVLKALIRASLIDNGKTGPIDLAVRDLLTAYNHDIPHGIGHAVMPGTDVHCYSRLFGNSDIEFITNGTYFTIEPGIYIQNSYGCRVENLFLASEDGCRLLTKIPIDVRSVLPELLCLDEREWLDRYNAEAIGTHFRYLSKTAAAWAIETTSWH